MNILVLCTGNSARSILLESILNTHGAGRVTAFSAGSHPTGKVHPAALALLRGLEHDTGHARSKSWDEFAKDDAPEMDVVITVCGSAAEETCPIWPGAPVRAHWGVEDPAGVPQEQWESAFQTAFDILNRRAVALLDQPIDSMEPGALSALLNRIGRMP